MRTYLFTLISTIVFASPAFSGNSCASGAHRARVFFELATEAEEKCANEKVMSIKCGRLFDRTICALNKGLFQIYESGLEGKNCNSAITVQRKGLAIIIEHYDYSSDLMFEGFAKLDPNNKESYERYCGS